MEHHANLVPWQQLAERTGAELAWLGLDDEGRLDLDNLERGHRRAHQGRWRSSIRATSSARQPGRDIAKRAHEVGALVVLDACQSVPHQPFSV